MRSGGGDGRRLGAAGALKAFGHGVILLAAFAFRASAWGGDPFAGERAGLLSRLAAAILQVGGEAPLGWTVWQGGKRALDHYPPDEGEDAPDEEATGHAGYRVAPVLPLIRPFLLVAHVPPSALNATPPLG